MEDKLQELQQEIFLLKERNKKVELDKKWETSKVRILAVCILTYFIISIVFYIIGVDNYLINAVIPTTGFYLSTQSLPILKKLWINKFYPNS